MTMLTAMVNRLTHLARAKIGAPVFTLALSSTRVRGWRGRAVAIIVALVALHQFFLYVVLAHLAPAWRVPVEATVYSVTGILAAWLGLTTLADALARREQAETELRAAFAELEFNHRKLLALHDFGQRVVEAHHEETILELGAQGAVQLTDARAATMVTFDETQDRLKLDVAWGLSERYLQALRARIEAGIPAARCRECAKLKAKAASDCPLFVGLHEVARAEGIGSLVCLPIVHEQERVGILSAYFPSADGPPEDHLRLLNILGGVMATALDSLRRRARQVDTLHAVDRATQTLQPLDDLATQVLDLATIGWEAHAGALFLYDPLHRLWQCRARHNLGDDWSDPSFQLALQLAQQAQASGAPVVWAQPDDAVLASAIAAPFVTEDQILGAIFLGSRRPRAFTEHHTELLTTMAHQIALAIRNVQLYAQVRQMTLLEERYRLAREIHDGLAQTLGYLSLQAERVEGLLAAGRYDASARELAEMRQALRAAYVDVREAIDGLRMSSQDPGNLTARLTAYLDEFARQTGLAARVMAEPPDIQVAPEIGLQLLRIAQEALTNVRKHAQAQKVVVALRMTTNEIEMTITDDGRGFPETLPAGRVYHSHGMATMRERAQGLGGTFTIATSPGQGTRITVVIPLKEKVKTVV